MDQPFHSDSGDRFTLFPNLPAELRLKIWDMALPSPRVRTIQPYYNWDVPFSYETTFGFGTCDKPPIHLQVNMEARSIALKTYCLAFDCDALCNKPKYFHFERDTLQLINWRRWPLDMSKDLSIIFKTFKNVQNISINILGLHRAGKGNI